MNKRAFSLLEVILASAMFVVFSVGAIATILRGLNLNRLGSEYTVATQYAAEGIEAARSIKNQAFVNLANSAGTGITKTGAVWTFSGANNVLDKYTRVISIADVYRDGSGNVVASGGTLDPNSKDVTSTVSWNFATGKNESISSTSYFTNWKAPFSKGGLLAYGNGGTTSDALMYKTFDGSAWSAAAAMADVDTGSTNKYARIIRVYASPTRNEKIAISRHYNGTTQWIYAQVFNGTSWGNVVQLSTWTAATRLDVQNFGGDYQANGNFAVVYSDNTTTPKMRYWNGSTWATATSLNVLSTGIPIHIRVVARPTSNELMAVFLNAGNDTLTEYNNGAGYATANWSAVTSHATNTVLNTKRIMDFQWSTNTPLNGVLIYTNSTTAKIITGRVWVANGTGGGAWGTAGTSVAQTNNMGALNLANRPGANEMEACDKDALATPTIPCRKLTFAGNVITWVTPTNPIVATATDTGIQLSYDIASEGQTGGYVLMVYSDNTAVPKFKKFTPGTTTWDAAATTITTTPYTLGIVKTVRMINRSDTDDMMVAMTDANLDLYTLMWDGTNNIMYTTPAGLAFTQHGIAGSAITDFWYDFAWDQF
jgi:hypothetical protein